MITLIWSFNTVEKRQFEWAVGRFWQFLQIAKKLRQAEFYFSFRQKKKNFPNQSEKVEF